MKSRHFLAIFGAGACALALTANAQEGQPQRIREGGPVMEAKLIQQVEPVYPPLAKQARVQGTVRLQAVISPEGNVQELEAISGHPLLVQSALDAARLWRYAPTLLNGAPITVVTTVDLRFTLDGGDTAERTESLEIPASFEADIRRLLEVTGAQKSWTQLARATTESLQSGLLRDLPPGARRQHILARWSEKMNATLNSDEYLRAMVAVYANRFTQAEVLELIRFFETPVGQRLAEVMPQLHRQLNAASEARLQLEVSRILRELKEEFPDLRKP